MTMLEYDDYELPLTPAVLPLRNGVDYPVEDETEKLLAEDRRLLRSLDPTVEFDYLTPDQLTLRHNREVIGPYGVPDRNHGGMYRRSYAERKARPVKLKQGDE